MYARTCLPWWLWWPRRSERSWVRIPTLRNILHNSQVVRALSAIVGPVARSVCGTSPSVLGPACQFSVGPAYQFCCRTAPSARPWTRCQVRLWLIAISKFSAGFYHKWILAQVVCSFVCYTEGGGGFESPRDIFLFQYFQQVSACMSHGTRMSDISLMTNGSTSDVETTCQRA
jgi:hypothetical protein